MIVVLYAVNKTTVLIIYHILSTFKFFNSKLKLIEKTIKYTAFPKIQVKQYALRVYEDNFYMYINIL